LFVAWIVFHVIVCIALVLVVLLQSSKGEGLAGSAFGGGGGGGISGAVFGGRGAATFLSKATSVLAVVFMLNCGALAFMSSNRSAGPVNPTEVTESAVTRQAQREMEEQMQRQQQQQQMAQPIVSDTGAAVNPLQQQLDAQSQPAETPAEEPSGN